MIYIPVIVVCEGEYCGIETSQRIPIQPGMTNIIVIDSSVTPENWGIKNDKLLCPACLHKQRLKVVR